MSKVRLKDIASFSKGSQINGDDLVDNGAYDYLNGGINPSGKWTEYNVSGDSITISEGGNSCGFVNYMVNPFWCGAHCYYLFDLKCNKKYLYYALKSQQDRIMKLRSGACMPNIKKSDIGNFVFEFDEDINIQNRVVEVLDKETRTIDLCNTILEKLDLLVKAKFVEMFGDPVSNPNNWEKVSLGELAEIKIGPFGTLLHKEDYIANGHALVNPSHIIDGKVAIDVKLSVSDEKYTELSAYHLFVDDVIMGRRGEMGRCAVVTESGLLCGTGSLIIRTNGRLKADYIQKIISFPSFKKAVADMAVGQTMPNLNVPIVSNFMIICPPIDVQERYYFFVEQIDKSKLKVKQLLEKAETLKKALMQEFFG